MLNLICRRNLGSVSKLYFVQFHSFSSLINSTSDFDSGNANGDPFAASYLIDRFGFSRERAIKAYALVKFRSSEKPDSVIAFFKEHGFNDSQIKRIVEKGPLVLKLKPQDSLLPKIEFFRSLGISHGDIVKIITTAGFIMTRSLENRIAPTFEFVKNMLKSEKDAIQAIKRFPSILTQDLQKNVPLNAEILRKAGVPEINVVYLFKRHPRALISSPDGFKTHVERVTELGFGPLTTIFVLGLIAMRMLSKLSWNKKMDIYKRWGYSEDQILLAFRRFPQCMVTSEDKINGVLGHIINKMGWDPLDFIGNPVIMSLSLEKTIIPRCSVYQVLQSKGLLKIKKKTNITTILKISKESFLERFVLPFADEVPELLKLYPCN